MIISFLTLGDGDTVALAIVNTILGASTGGSVRPGLSCWFSKSLVVVARNLTLHFQVPLEET